MTTTPDQPVPHDQPELPDGAPAVVLPAPEVIRDDGCWYPGELRGYRRRDGVWEDDVLWTRDVGLHYVGWFPEVRVRRATARRSLDRAARASSWAAREDRALAVRLRAVLVRNRRSQGASDSASRVTAGARY